MPYQPIEGHRNSGDASRDVLIVWDGPEAEVLTRLGIPTRYYINPYGPQLGLGNTAPELMQEWIRTEELHHLVSRAALSTLDIPSGES